MCWVSSRALTPPNTHTVVRIKTCLELFKFFQQTQQM